MLKIKDFSSFDLLAEVTPAELEDFEDLCEECVYSDGEALFKEDEEALYMNLIRSGRVSLRMNLPNEKTIVVYTVEPGEIVGWSALAPHTRYTTEAMAVGEVTTFRLEGKALKQLFDKDTYLGYVVYRKLLDVVAERLSEARERIASLESEQPSWGV